MKIEETDNEIALNFLLNSYEQVKDEKIIIKFMETIGIIVDSVFLEVLYDDERKEMLSKSLAVMLSLSMYLREEKTDDIDLSMDIKNKALNKNINEQ